MAKEFPDLKFTIVDMVVDLPNVNSVVFKEHEGSFLVGALASLASKSAKIGFVGGMDIPLIRRFMWLCAGRQTRQRRRRSVPEHDRQRCLPGTIRAVVPSSPRVSLIAVPTPSTRPRVARGSAFTSLQKTTASLRLALTPTRTTRSLK